MLRVNPLRCDPINWFRSATRWPAAVIIIVQCLFTISIHFYFDHRHARLPWFDMVNNAFFTTICKGSKPRTLWRTSNRLVDCYIAQSPWSVVKSSWARRQKRKYWARGTCRCSYLNYIVLLPTVLPPWEVTVMEETMQVNLRDKRVVEDAQNIE